MKKLLVTLVAGCLPLLLPAQINLPSLQQGYFILMPGEKQQHKEPEAEKPAPAPVDNFIMNHFAIGLGVGLDGATFEIAVPMTWNVIFRGGFGTFSLIKGSGYKRSYPVDSEEPWKIKQTINGTMRSTMDNLHLLMDIFPTSSGAFHFTLGGYFTLHSSGIFRAMTDDPLPIPVEQYRVTGIPFRQDQNVGYITTDAKGDIVADGRFGIGRVAPYAGIGFSRAVSDGFVRLLLDVGALYTRSIDVFSYDYGINGTATKPKEIQLTPKMIPGFDADLVEQLQKLPIYPMLKLSLFFRLR